MKSVRIYKDDIRTHILRSLFFTDAVLTVLGALITAGVIYMLLKYGIRFFSWNLYLATVAIGEIVFLAAITQKIDNQPISAIVPRSIRFKASKKKVRQSQFDPYFLDFSIQDSAILRKNSIIRVFEVMPFDIALLNEQDREHFFVKVKQFIHVLSFPVQLIVRKEKTTTADLSKHFFSIYDQANTKREPLIGNYINDMTDLVTSHEFLLTHHYAILSTPCNTGKADDKIKALKKLSDMSARFMSALSTCQIDVHQLENEELISFARSLLR